MNTRPVPTNGREKTARVDLGLALLSVVRIPGQSLTVADIAAWCDCKQQSIAKLEKRALRKLQVKLIESGCDRELVSEAAGLLERHDPAA